MAHWHDGKILKRDANCESEDKVEYPNGENPVAEKPVPTEPYGDCGEGEGQPLDANIAECAAASAMERGLSDHHGKWRHVLARRFAPPAFRVEGQEPSKAEIGPYRQPGSEQCHDRPDDVHNPHALRMTHLVNHDHSGRGEAENQRENGDEVEPVRNNDYAPFSGFTLSSGLASVFASPVRSSRFVFSSSSTA